MTDPAIRAALEAAESAMRQSGLGATREEVAEAVAVFLRALPGAHLTSATYYQPAHLAAAVEEAARDE